MLRALRHLVAIAVLPFSVTILVPLWLARRNGVVLEMESSPLRIFSQLAGLAVLAVGLVLFV